MAMARRRRCTASGYAALINNALGGARNVCADNHAIQQGVRIAFDLIAIHSAQYADFWRRLDRHPESFWRGTHPRGRRWATQGWTVEIRISLVPHEVAGHRTFSAPERRRRVEISPHPAWVRKAHGAYDTHRPERFTRVRFSEEGISE